MIQYDSEYQNMLKLRSSRSILSRHLQDSMRGSLFIFYQMLTNICQMQDVCMNRLNQLCHNSWTRVRWMIVHYTSTVHCAQKPEVFQYYSEYHGTCIMRYI